MVLFKTLKYFFILSVLRNGAILADSNDVCLNNEFEQENIKELIPKIIPPLNQKEKGDVGKIGIIGGSTEYTGAPYFSAISALKVGADLVYVITTESAAPVIKTYSPDLIVYPFLNEKNIAKVKSLLVKMDVVVIGPGLGREEETLKLLNDIVERCRELKKALVIDADGLYALSKNLSLINDYPSPGIIITPNHREATMLKNAISNNVQQWYNFWGENVSVLIKGEEDHFHSNNPSYDWALSDSGSGRRAGGQGDILSGSLGTFYNWAIKSNICGNQTSLSLAQSVASYSAAYLTRTCNYKAFAQYGRSMIASDMITTIYTAFHELSK